MPTWSKTRLAQTFLQLCRPLSGAVRGRSITPTVLAPGLQLCRPLSGAVRGRWSRGRSGGWSSFNCAAPFRGRLGPGNARIGNRRYTFNCAAPFRGRLAVRQEPHMAIIYNLQLCRPLSGAVRIAAGAEGIAQPGLQLCRPLSGAVSWDTRRSASGGISFNCAAPFRGRLAVMPPKSWRSVWCLQLCRPLSGAVRG